MDGQGASNSPRHLRAGFGLALVLAAVLGFGSTSASAAILQNDTFSDGDDIACQVGFFAGESAAAAFTPPPAKLPAWIDTVQVLGCNETVDVGLAIYPDALDGDPEPDGAALWSGSSTYSLVPGGGMASFDLSDEDIVADAGIRVAVTGSSGGVRLSVDPGPQVAQRNSIFALGMWGFAETFGVTKNYVIRATYTPLATVKLTGKPPKTVRSAKRKVFTTFKFAANKPGVDIACRMDSAAFRPCSSPHIAKVRRGKHRFQVRALERDVPGRTASYSFKVVKK